VSAPAPAGRGAGRFLRLGIIGDPVEHSQSPALQRAFLNEAGREGSYETIRVAAGDGASAIARLRRAGYVGLNVTTPLKEEAFRASDRVDAFAATLGAVNTLVFGTRGVYGFNTDGAGALGAVDVAAGDGARGGLSVLVLGAGPTARATIVALARARHRVVIWNRTSAKAEALARESGVAMWTAPHSAPVRSRFDVVFSTLAPEPALPPEILVELLAAERVIDANYGPRATLATQLGRDVIDGLAMLRASARASFARWSSDEDDDALERATRARAPDESAGPATGV
jgi:shikimate dehydrogenase